MRILLLSILSIFLYSCDISKKDRIVIFNESNNIKNLSMKKVDFWIPERKDIKILDSIMDKAIKKTEFNFIKKPLKINFKDYYKQYIPYISKNGEKIILINAFCELLPSPTEKDLDALFDWKNYFLSVDDGGNCFWQIKVNLDTKDIFDFNVNSY